MEIVIRGKKSYAALNYKLNVAQIINSLQGHETSWEKEKILVTSIFSFSQNVFKNTFPCGGYQNSDLLYKGL